MYSDCIVFSGSAAVFAGKPGRYYRQDAMESDGLITDWSKCVKNISVSSRESTTNVDDPRWSWQSCGAQGKVGCLTNLLISIGFLY